MIKAYLLYLFATLRSIASASTSDSGFAPQSGQALKTAINKCTQPSTDNFWTSEAGRDKREKICKAGQNNLVVVADFDHTLTPFTYEGIKMYSAYSVLRSGLLGPDYNARATALKEAYESATEVPEDERRKATDVYMQQKHDLLMEFGLTRKTLVELVQIAIKDQKIRLRPGADALLRRLQELDIPVVIFSAGLGDVIEIFLEQLELLSDNIATVANRIQFDEAGKLIGFSQPIITPLNKGEQVIEGDLALRLAGRSNVLLLGDSLGDTRMANGFDGASIVLKHGFLNNNVKTRLTLYQEQFDELTLNDGSFQSILDFIDRVEFKIWMDPKSRPLRVLCLHGFRTSGTILRSQARDYMHFFKDQLEFDFIDAPHTASGPPMGNIQQIYPPPYHEWWSKPEEAFKNDKNIIYEGAQESLSYVENYIRKNGPYDGIMGFSQGGALAATICMREARLHEADSELGIKVAFKLDLGLKFGLVVSGFVPKDNIFGKMFLDPAPVDFPMFLTYGTDKDWMDERSTELAKRFTGKFNKIVPHSGGHRLPSRTHGKEYFQQLAEFLRQFPQ